tara:strand:- start:916 stop:1347 length:432 start_codon:yes stop_codon:yes gene_type:complete
MTSSFQLAGNSDILEKANKFFGDPNFQKLPASVQETFAMMPIIQGLSSQQSVVPTQEELDRMSRFQQEQARYSQELGKESVEKAYQYSTLANIPKQIAEGFGNAAMIKVLGARNASEAMNQTLASYPRLNLQVTSFQPQKYFS